MGYLEDTDFLHIIGDFLSLITIASCVVAKVPQIRIILKVKKTEGISLISLLMELFSYSVSTLYNYTNGYSIMNYAEYIILILQEWVLILVILYYKGLLVKKTYYIALLYAVFCLGFAYGILPKFILLCLMPLGTPISATSKIMQLYEIIRTKDASSVSLTTWFISAFTNLTRIYTIFLDSADKMLLTNFIISTTLSSCVYLAAMFYKKKKQD